MTAEEYLRRVEFSLRDLPWRMRQDLAADLRGHLAELPADTDLAGRLGAPEEYAADLRSAEGLERRRGPFAFVRARRPRNVVLTVVALTLLVLAIGAVVWIDSYQPLATGNSAYEPGIRSSPASDGNYVVFHQGRRFRYGMTIWNTGRFTVRVLGIPDFYGRHMIGVPVSARLLMSAPAPFNRGGIPEPYTPFRPFDLAPGEQRGIIFAGTYDQPCDSRDTGTIGWVSIPVRYSFLWHTETVQIPLPQTLAFVFRKDAACP